MKKGIVKRYTDAKGKKKAGTSLMKMGVEGAGALAGGGAGAIAGIASPFVGIALLFVGQFFGDETGLLKVTGAGMIGYGVANAMTNRDNAKAASLNGLGEVKGNVTQRLVDYKDNLMHAFYLDKLFKKDGDGSDTKSVDLGSTPYLDTSGLDVFSEFNEQFAIRQANDEVEEEQEEQRERGIYYEQREQGEFNDEPLEEMADISLI